MKRWERQKRYSFESINRHHKPLRSAIGVLIAANLISLGLLHVENDIHQASEKSATAHSLGSLAGNSAIKTTTTTELVPSITSTTLAGVMEYSIPQKNNPVSSVTTTTFLAPKSPMAGDRSAQHVKSQSINRDERCQQAIANANVQTAPNYFFVCGPEDKYNTLTDGGVCPYYESSDEESNDFYECEEGMKAGDIRIHPDDWDSNDDWIYTVKHEVGHTWCVYLEQDYTEKCADDWAHHH